MANQEEKSSFEKRTSIKLVELSEICDKASKMTSIDLEEEPKIGQFGGFVQNSKTEDFGSFVGYFVQRNVEEKEAAEYG